MSAIERSGYDTSDEGQAQYFGPAAASPLEMDSQPQLVPEDWEAAYAAFRDGDRFPPETAALKVAFAAGMAWQGKRYGDDWSEWVQRQSALAANEIERLSAALKTANEQAERFEREWYLRGDVLEWYRDEAKALAKNLAGGAHTSGVLASVTVLALDAGQRADVALGLTR